MSDEDAYKVGYIDGVSFGRLNISLQEFMRRKLAYQEWENSVLREAMKRIAQQGGA
jgi:hypothetical protein